MKQLLFIVLALTPSAVQAQEDEYPIQWIEQLVYSIGEEEEWSVDGLENVYISDKGQINKYDSTGVLKFSQSIKSLGRMTQMVPVNTMKLIHFSEEQQTLCFFDNTLSDYGGCLDLAERDIANAAMISASSQPDKIWILDNLNSRLRLVSLNNPHQEQELKNLRGVLDLDHITQIRERNGRLFVLDPNNGVYVFDIYGSLIGHIEQESIQQLDANEQTLFTLRGNELLIHDLRMHETFPFKLPIDGVFEFEYQNRYFFFRNAEGVHKYALQFSE